jgi:hypothetical protein
VSLWVRVPQRAPEKFCPSSPTVEAADSKSVRSEFESPGGHQRNSRLEFPNCGFGRMAQATGFQPDHAGSIPAIHSSNSRQSMACNAKRSSEQSFKLPISGFEPRARHQYPRAFPPNVSRVTEIRSQNSETKILTSTAQAWIG